jgi:hypothetical protein
MNEAATVLGTADIQEILRLLPHRYPFLLVDRIIEIDDDNSAIGIKNVTANEPHFTGHFPEKPIMPDGRRDLCAQDGNRQQSRVFHDDRQCPLPQARRARRPGGVPCGEAEAARQYLEVSL